MVRSSFSLLFLAAIGTAVRAQPAPAPDATPPSAPAAPSTAAPPPGAPSPSGAPSASDAPAADATTPPFGRALNFLARVGAEFGGAEIVRVEKTNGDTSSLKAGQLATVSLGVIYQPAAPFALELTVGYKIDRVGVDDGSIKFTRFPVDLIASTVPAPRARIGVGVTYHVHPTFSCHVESLCDADVGIDAPWGAIFQVGYTIPLHRSIGVDLAARLTWLSYSAKNPPPGTEPIDGSSVGLFAGVRL